MLPWVPRQLSTVGPCCWLDSSMSGSAGSRGGRAVSMADSLRRSKPQSGVRVARMPRACRHEHGVRCASTQSPASGCVGAPLCCSTGRAVQLGAAAAGPRRCLLDTAHEGKPTGGLMEAVSPRPTPSCTAQPRQPCHESQQGTSRSPMLPPTLPRVHSMHAARSTLHAAAPPGLGCKPP